LMHIATIHHTAVSLESRKPRGLRLLPTAAGSCMERRHQIKGHLAIV
jgi:hypothetical protein